MICSRDSLLKGARSWDDSSTASAADCPAMVVVFSNDVLKQLAGDISTASRVQPRGVALAVDAVEFARDFGR